MAHLRIYHHPDCAQHQPPSGHAESPQRWQAITHAWQGLADCELIASPLATDEEITRLHPADYWQELKRREPAADAAPIALDPDTWLGHGSIAAAARGAGAVLAGVEYSWARSQASDPHADGSNTNGSCMVFCAARPPGHHAGLASPMGFCLINPIALGAQRARDLGAARVAIVDFDVHHGNGTQDIFQSDPKVLYASSHQMPLYPGTGYEEETGVGNLINRPLPAGTGSADFRRLWGEDILPQIAAFQPEFLLISAGFDAHADDPLAQLQLSDDDYHWLGLKLAQLAQQHCRGRLVAMSEGGYNLAALTRAVRAFLQGLLAAVPASP